jgi:hypothetical protein
MAVCSKLLTLGEFMNEEAGPYPCAKIRRKKRG